MGHRKLRRVPIDFNWPLRKTWAGYLNPYYVGSIDCPACTGRGDDASLACSRCDGNGEIPSTPEAEAWRSTEPPTGDGYQIWETTSEGSPVTPVFANLDDLCAYAAEHCTVFASIKTTAAEWRRMIDADRIYHVLTFGDVTVIL